MTNPELLGYVQPRPIDTPVPWQELLEHKKQSGLNWVEILRKEIEEKGVVRMRNIALADLDRVDVDDETSERVSGQRLNLEGTSLAKYFVVFSGLNERNLYDEIHDGAGLFRLLGVQQLSFLNFPNIEPSQQRVPDINECAPHSRYKHSIHVAALLEIVMHCNGLDAEMIDKAVVSGFVHDAATVAGGDVTKNAIPGRLQEENLSLRVLEKDGMANLLAENSWRAEEIVDIIKNQGVVGRVLDFCDRLSYTIHDSVAARSIFYDSEESGPDEGINYMYKGKGKRIKTLLAEHPNFGDVIFGVRIDKDRQEMYVEDGENLGVFLTLRALMHRDLYLDPVGRIVQDALLVPLIREAWAESEEAKKTGHVGEFNVDNLLSWGNQELERFLAQRVGIGDGFMLPIYFSKELERRDIRVRVCGSKEEAEGRKAALLMEGRTIVNEVDDLKGFNPATNILVKTSDDLLPFSAAYPRETKKINKIVEQSKRYKIYHANC